MPTHSDGQGAASTGAQLVPMSWIEVLVAVNDDIIACEKRFHRQCFLVADCAANGPVTAEDGMLLDTYLMSVTLLHVHRDSLSTDAHIDARVLPISSAAPRARAPRSILEGVTTNQAQC
jgi:hypothetical protein